MLYPRHKICPATAGFSLVELSIVIVVIGLLVGGIFAGQTMIRSGQLKSILSDQSKYKAATLQFKRMYEALPGDIQDATDYWTSAGGTGLNSDPACANAMVLGQTTCNGNGDGIMDSNEWRLAWAHLGLAKLVSRNYTGDQSVDVEVGVNVPASQIKNAGWSFADNQGIATGNGTYYDAYRGLMLFFGKPVSLFSNVTIDAVLTPTEAQEIDRKMDDGLPAVGSIFVTKPSLSYTANCATSNTDASALYNVSYKPEACNLVFVQPEN